MTRKLAEEKARKVAKERPDAVVVSGDAVAAIGNYEVLRHAGAFESDAVLFFADRISGSYNFVTAMPVSRLIVFLREQGMSI